MHCLPLNFISEQDKSSFGDDILNLAKLKRANFPILDGVAVSQNQIDNDLFKAKKYLFNGEIVKKNELLNRLKDLKSPQVIYFLESQTFPFRKTTINNFTSLYDPNLKQVTIESNTKLHPELLDEVDEIVKKGNKHLILPQVYSFSQIGSQIQITKLNPFTQVDIYPEKESILSSTFEVKPKTHIKSTVKLFVTFNSSLPIDSNFDGVLIKREDFKNIDDLVIRVSRLIATFPNTNLIYQLADIKDDDLRGALRLLNQKSLLDKSIEEFKFLKYKRGITNLTPALPCVRSVQELKDFKQFLPEQFWIEFCSLENIINFDQYLKTGVMGVILDFDSILKAFLNYQDNEKEYYRNNTSSLMSLVANMIKTASKNRIPVLIKGNISFEVMEELINLGVYGIISEDNLSQETLPEQLSWIEVRNFAKNHQLN